LINSLIASDWFIMKKLISNILFTKNRPLQLDAYLESLYRYLPSDIIRTYVIYKAELFGQEYEQLFRKFADCIIIREKDFHSDLLRVLGLVETKYILFGIDDVVYFDPVDFGVIDEIFAKYPDDIFGFTFRFNAESIKQGSNPVNETIIAGQTVYHLDWMQGRTPTTRYPFELCATIYPTVLVKKIIAGTMNNNPLIKKLFSPSSALMTLSGKSKLRRKVLKYFGYFYDPNTFESWNCRWCQNNKEQLPKYTYFQKICASAIQVNMVNTSTKKQFPGSSEYTVETLNDKYRNGFRLDIDFVSKKKPTGTHCDGEYFRVVSA